MIVMFQELEMDPITSDFSNQRCKLNLFFSLEYIKLPLLYLCFLERQPCFSPTAILCKNEMRKF